MDTGKKKGKKQNENTYTVGPCWLSILTPNVFLININNSYIYYRLTINQDFPGGPAVKNPPAMWETWIQSLAWEDPLEKSMATHSSILFFFLTVP